MRRYSAQLQLSNRGRQCLSLAQLSFFSSSSPAGPRGKSLGGGSPSVRVPSVSLNKGGVPHPFLSRLDTARMPSILSTTVRLYSSGGGDGEELTIQVPPIAESVSSGKLKEWVVRVGDAVAEDQELCHIESDKLEIPVRAPCSGVILSLHATEGDVVDVGQKIVVIQKGAGAVAATPTLSVVPNPSTSQPKPAAPKKVEGTSAPPSNAATRTVHMGDMSTGTRRVRTSSMRMRIADRLKASQNTAAMLTTFNEVDMSHLIHLRQKYKDEFMKKHGVKLGFMSAFAKASARALLEVPIVNASWEEEHIVYHDFVDISVAVATPTGLVVPVLRDVHKMSFVDIEKKIAEFGNKAKNKTLSLAEMTGGTFTISNGGVFGSWMGTPIINPPQSAILGMHATKPKPWVAEDGKTIVVRPIMALALTYDHRLIDGRDAVTFLVKIKDIIEDPQRLLLDL